MDEVGRDAQFGRLYNCQNWASVPMPKLGVCTHVQIGRLYPCQNWAYEQMPMKLPPSQSKIRPYLHTAHVNDFVGACFASVIDDVELEVVGDVALEGEVPSDVLSAFETVEHFVGEGGVFAAVVLDVDVIGAGL